MAANAGVVSAGVVIRGADKIVNTITGERITKVSRANVIVITIPGLRNTLVAYTKVNSAQIAIIGANEWSMNTCAKDAGINGAEVVVVTSVMNAYAVYAVIVSACISITTGNSRKILTHARLATIQRAQIVIITF